MYLREGDTILFQGDSITNAYRRPEEFNTAYQLGSGYPLLIAATLQSRQPCQDWTFLNRGVSGDCLPDLVARWEADCLELRPTVLSVLIGINDVCVASGLPPSRAVDACRKFEENYNLLLRLTRETVPGIRLVLIAPFALPCGIVSDTWIPPLRACQDAVARLAKRYDACLVVPQPVLDAACRAAPRHYWMYDGIHLTAAGHGLLADCWLSAVQKGNSPPERHLMHTSIQGLEPHHDHNTNHVTN
jgi:lysophospholipase L1-like esterase